MSILPQLAEAAERLNKESSHQRALFCWAQTVQDQYPDLKYMFAIPNGGERPKPVAAAMKAEGAKDGVPDILLPIKRGAWMGLWIELKRPAKGNMRQGVPSKEQKLWIAFLQNQGYGAMVCYGWQHAKQVIIDYLEYK